MNNELAHALSLFWEDSAPAFSIQGAAVAEALEAKYDIRLPEDFKAYLIEAAPAETCMRDMGFTIWAPEQIKNIPDECGPNTPPGQINPEIEAEADRYLLFADFLCWCYAYGICCSDGPNRGKVAIIADRPDRFVADSFGEFLIMAAENSGHLHAIADDTAAQ